MLSKNRTGRKVVTTLSGIAALVSVAVAATVTTAAAGSPAPTAALASPTTSGAATPQSEAATAGATGAGATLGALSVTYEADGADTITIVVLAEGNDEGGTGGVGSMGGGTVVAQETLTPAVARRFDLPSGTYVVDVTQSSGVSTSGDVAMGDVAISSATANRFGPVSITAGGVTDVRCDVSGCEVR